MLSRKSKSGRLAQLAVRRTEICSNTPCTVLKDENPEMRSGDVGNLFARFNVNKAKS
jgi:hypothetical protein